MTLELFSTCCQVLILHLQRILLPVLRSKKLELIKPNIDVKYKFSTSRWLSAPLTQRRSRGKSPGNEVARSRLAERGSMFCLFVCLFGLLFCLFVCWFFFVVVVSKVLDEPCCLQNWEPFLSLFFRRSLYRLLFPPFFFFVGGLVTFRTLTNYLPTKKLCNVLIINSKNLFVCLFF